MTTNTVSHTLKRHGFHEKMMSMTAFRDIVHQMMILEDGKALSTRLFKDYKSIRYGSESHREDVRATGILDIWNWEQTDENAVKKEKQLMQALQYSLYLKPYTGEGEATDDTRTSDVFSSYPFSPNQITIPFFTRTSKSSEHNRDRSLDTWNTDPSTRFEMSLFLMFTIYLSHDSITSTGQSVLGKRKRCSEFTKTRINSQKLAFVVQRVTRAWDRLARNFGFRGIENMSSPYIVPSSTLDGFRVLPNRVNGYAPSDLERTFSERLSPTTNKQLVSQRALQYTDEVDSLFRRTCTYFLSDLEMVANDTNLYTETTTIWRYGGIFPKDGKVNRFQDIVGELQGLQRAPGIDEELDFLETKPVELMPEWGTDTTIANDDSPDRESSTFCNEDCKCHEARSLVNMYMMPNVRLHCASFSDIITADNLLRPKEAPNITGKVQLMIMAPPPSSSLEDDAQYQTQDVPLETDMESVIATVNNLLRPGGHVFIFSSIMQVSKWVQLLKEKLSDDDENESEPCFHVDDHAFFFTYKPGCPTRCKNDRDESNITDPFGIKNVSMTAVHAWKLGCSQRNAQKMIRLRAFGHVHSSHLATTNHIDMIPRVTQDEAVWIFTEDGSGKRMLCPQQISENLLRELVCRYSHPGDIVVDLFCGTSSTGIATIKIPKEGMRIFVGTEIDEKTFAMGEKRLQNAFASVLADDNQRAAAFPEEEFPEEVIQAAQMVFCHTRTSKIERNIWGPPPGLPVLSILPRYITNHLLLRWQTMGRGASIDGKPFHQWPIDLQNRIHSVDMDELLAIKCTHTGLYVAQSKIKHDSAGLGVFANRSFSKNEVIAAYYGRIVYDDLSDRHDMKRMYGDGFTACRVDDFLTYNMGLKVCRTCKFKDMLPKEYGTPKHPHREVYVVPFMFNVAARINDPRYIDGDYDRHGCAKVRECNVRFIQKQRWEKVKEIRHILETDALKVVATRNIKKNEELYVDYGTSHMLNEIAAYCRED